MNQNHILKTIYVFHVNLIEDAMGVRSLVLGQWHGFGLELGDLF